MYKLKSFLPKDWRFSVFELFFVEFLLFLDDEAN